MKTIISALFIIFQVLHISAQITSQRLYKADVKLAFTGVINNQFDSVFNIEYIFNANDFKFDISQVFDPIDSISFKASDLLSPHVSYITSDGSIVTIDKGEFYSKTALIPFIYTDSNGVNYPVILETPWGEIQDVNAFNLQQAAIHNGQ